MKKKSETKQKNNAKRLQGVVIGNKMDRTVRVAIENPRSHPVYHKVLIRRKVFFAHTDEKIEEGKVVVIRQSRPYSKNVKWVVERVVE